MNARSMACWIVLLACVVTLSACEESQGRMTGESPSSGSDVVARVDVTPVTKAEIESAASGELIRLRQERYDVLRDALDRKIIETMDEKEAAARGTSIDDLVREEVLAKIVEPTQCDVEQFYELNQTRSGGRSYDELKDQIFAMLRNERVVNQENVFHTSLRAK